MCGALVKSTNDFCKRGTKMATKKIYDAVVVTGEYQDRNGQTKKRYENVGSVMENDNGMFLMLKKTFNPAGVASSGDSILIGFYEPKEQGGASQSRHQPSAPSPDLGDDIPF